MIFALAGNQNCGKTTLFNQLTGSNQHIGNFPGVTIQAKEGIVRGQNHLSVVDLPGVYSLSPYTAEEIVTREFLITQRPAAIINIVDGTNLQRNLYLTLQLLELEIPMVLAVNMMDQLEKSGNQINLASLEQQLGIPVVGISAAKGQGLAKLMMAAQTVAEKKQLPCPTIEKNVLQQDITSLEQVLSSVAARQHLPVAFAATRVLEGDRIILRQLDLNETEQQEVAEIISKIEKDSAMDHIAALADMRYAQIAVLYDSAIHDFHRSREQIRTDKIDDIVTHRFLAIPLFFLIMLGIFWLSFGVIGTPLSDGLAGLIDRFSFWVDGLLGQFDISPWLHSLIIDGIFAGVGSVLSFLPTIICLFFFLSILEDSGYMARVALIMDKALRHIGLSGKSFVPMIIGFGCSVPAIMATRTLASPRDRQMTIMLVPFMSCSAKLPIYAVFAAAFFPSKPWLLMMIIYLLGIGVAILAGLLLNRTAFRGDSTPFLMELPPYRFPTLRTIGLNIWDRAKDFITKAFTIIFLASIIIWFLQRFNFQLQMVDNSENSILSSLGKIIAPVFTPLGFGNWQATAALITGFSAKETVISTLSVLLSNGDVAGLPLALTNFFTPLAAFSFLCFCLLYMPCVAAFATGKRELKSWRKAIEVGLFQTATAYIVAMIVYQIGSLLGL